MADGAVADTWGHVDTWAQSPPDQAMLVTLAEAPGGIWTVLIPGSHWCSSHLAGGFLPAAPLGDTNLTSLVPGVFSTHLVEALSPQLVPQGRPCAQQETPLHTSCAPSHPEQLCHVLTEAKPKS